MLDIKDNQFVTLLGPSGCGKTTTLRMIAGYIVPDAGTIHVNGRLVSAPGSVVPPDQRGMGMVFQNYAVWPHKTVYENVVFGLKVRKTPAAAAKKKVADTLSLVNLTGLEQRYPNELSGGQQQRVALARSLVVEPEILLLDEPLSNLDAKLREQMRVELKRLQRRTGITFVYVTHDQAEALALSDHIAVIHGGRLQQYGTPQDVYARPANRVVADFMGLVNLISAKVVAPGTIEAAGGLKFLVPLPDGSKMGDSVEVSIRPENVRLSAGGTACAQPSAASKPPLPSARFSATSANIMPVSTPVRRFGYRPIRARSSRSATRSPSRSTPPNAACFAVPRLNPSASNGSSLVTIQVDNIHVQGTEHWTKKGDAKLFLWEKRRAQNTQERGTILFVHGSSMASQPTFDLQVPGQPGRDGLFRRPRLRHLERGHGGLRPLHQGSRHRRHDLRRRRRPEGRDRLHLQDPQPHRPAAGVRHLVGRIARGAVRAAPSQPRQAARARRPCLDRRRQPDAGRAQARNCRNCSRPSGGRSTASSCARSSSATIPAPPTTK